MKALLGFDAGARNSGKELRLEWDSKLVVNPHFYIAGMTGSGKTHLIRSLIADMDASATAPARFHIFDVHGDIHVPGASSVLFNEQGQAGLNPLRVTADPVFGGLRKQIQLFIETINRVSSTPLGIKQVSVIRNLLYDVYEMHGFKRDDPSTWHVDPSTEVLVNGGAENRLYLNVPREEKDDAKALGARWDPDNSKRLWWIPADLYKGSITKWLPKTVGRAHPTVEEVLIHARRLLQISFCGSDQSAVMNLELFHKAASAYQRKALEKVKHGDREWVDPALRDAIDKAGQRAVSSYADYVESVSTGNELENLMKYDSTSVLSSVVDRLETLVGTGLFKNKPMKFDPNAAVWRYGLEGLVRIEEQKMFVFFRLAEIWAEARARGHSNEIRDVLVIDEFGQYANAAQDPDHIINVLATQARKYGVSLIVAGQDPETVPEALMGSFGTKIIVGVDESKWPLLTRKMRIDDALLQWIKIRKTMAVQIKEQGGTKNVWRWVHRA